MTKQAVTIVSTMGVVFALTVGVSLWRDHRLAPAPEPTLQQPAPTRAPTVAAESQAAVVNEPTSPPVAPNPEPEADLSLEPVPVFYVAIADPNDPGTRIPTLMNPSPKTLEVSVTALNTATGNQSFARVVIAHGERKNLSQLGFVAQHGDQITLHSPPYRDRQLAAL